MAPITGFLNPGLGFGLGLRKDHYEAVLADRPPLGWFEIISENYLGKTDGAENELVGGKPLDYLERVRAHYPMAMHGVSLSVGGTDPLDFGYLAALKALAARIEPIWISDHLCWTGVSALKLHDLMPLPYTEEAVRLVAARVGAVQEFLGRRILIENVSSYLSYHASEMSEWEFLSAVAEQADCLILLDINNIYVSAQNHEFDPIAYLEGVPVERVQQFHLAGHRDLGDYRIDTHDEPICDPVWDLYREAVRRFGSVTTMIERDDHIPPLPELLAELAQAERIAGEVMAKQDKHVETRGAALPGEPLRARSGAGRWA